jgi:hypothetical protein
MGIKGLMKLISDHAPAAVKEREIENFFGKINNSIQVWKYLYTNNNDS